jgi:predicted phage tail protein
MTTVKIYGFLAKEFGSTIKVHLGKINDALNAIDAIKNGFRKKINELNKNKFNYSFYFDSKKKTLHMLPIIGGSGKAWKWIVTAILVVAAIVCFVLGQPGLGMMFLNAAFTMGQAAYMAMKKPPSPAETSESIGGATYTSEASGKSYIFNNKQNTSSQGSIVDLGYGKFKTSSKIIAISVKTYPSNITFVEESDILLNAEKINIYD